MKDERVGPIRQGVMWLRRLILPSSGLLIGESQLHAKKDANGNIDPYWKRQDGTEMNLTGEVKFCRATSSLTLTTSAQSITGDGNSSKVRLLLPTIGEWLIAAIADLYCQTIDPDNLVAKLYVNDSGTAESGACVFGPTTLADMPSRGTVGQQWKVTTTSANTPVELKAYKTAGVGVAYCMSENTTLVAAIGAGGGSTVESVDHGTLTGLGDDDHTQYGQLADAETVPGLWDFTNGLKADTIAESTGAAGVTADGVLLKDGVVTVGDVAFDDATSDPLAVAASAADGTENSVARKDHAHAMGILTTRGDLLTRDASDPIRLAVGAANTVLWTDGTDPSWSAAPRLANIADVAGTTRITTSAASPHVHIDETMRVDQALGIMSNPSTAWAEFLTVSPTLPSGLTPAGVSVLKVNPTLQTTQGFGIYYALEGILNVASTGSGQTIYEYGLSYVVVAVNGTVNVNTWAELMGLNMGLTMNAGASATLNVTLAASGKLTTPTFVGTQANINVATMHGLMVLNHGHPRVANSYGIRIYDQTGSSAAAYGIYVEDADTYALWMDAGLSRFDGDGTHVFELPVNAVDPTGGGGAAAGRIPCTIGGATRHLAYY